MPTGSELWRFPLDWPLELLPEGLLCRIREAPALHAERPTPLLLPNPDVPWHLGPAEDPPARGVVFTEDAPWRAPVLPEGPRVALFRAVGEARGTGLLLRLSGFTPVYIPLLRFRYLAPPKEFPRLLYQADVLVFTSPRGVEGTFRWLQELRIRLPERPVVAIGPSTVRALEARGCFGVRFPEKFSAEGLVALFERENVSGKRILLLRSGGRSLLPEKLRERGAVVMEVAPYRTEAYPLDRLEMFLEDLLAARHWMLTSPSTVETLHRLLSHHGLAVPREAVLWAIGPATREAMETRGWPVRESPVHTPEGMVEALIQAEKQGGV